MKRDLYFVFAFILVSSLLTTTAFAAPMTIVTSTPTHTSELGLLKVCKAAGTGVSVGQLFTIRVGNNSYNVPAGPTEGGYCVLAGEYPIDTQVTVQEVVTSGYYLSRIEVRPDRAVSKDLAQATVIVRVGSGVTEVIFTNRLSGSPTPTRTATPLVTNTPRPTSTSTATPGCAPNCTPTSTPIPRGRLQICKEADGSNVSGYFTFRFAGRSVTIPVGACSALIRVDVGPLTVTEDSQAGYSLTDIYTIPASRLINKDLNARRANVTIVEGNASTQTIVIFRNKATNAAHTPTPTGTLTNTTPTNTPTPTGTGTPSSCQPVTADLGQVPVGNSVEGFGTVHPALNIDAVGTAVHILEGIEPIIYASNVNGVTVGNGGMVTAGGFSDPVTQAAQGAPGYTFTFASGVSVNNFSLHMLDYGDFNPTGSSSHLVTMTAYDASNGVVSSQQLSYTSSGNMSSQYGNLLVSGDASTASAGQPGNWPWNVSGVGIVRVVLEFGAGFDPNLGFDSLTFSNCGTPIPVTNTPTATATGTPSSCQPVTADFAQVPVGNSVEGFGAVHPALNIDAKGTAVHVLQGANPAVYAATVNGVLTFNGGMVTAGGFSDLATQLAGEPHQYTFTFAPGISVNNFLLHMLDFGDFNPTGSSSHLVTMTAYNASNVAVSQQQLNYTTTGDNSPQFGNMLVAGDASASSGQPGNWTWNVSGIGIVRVVLEFGAGYDPNIGFDSLTFSNCGTPIPVTNTPTATATGTPSSCQPTVVRPNFAQIPVGSSVEGLGAADPRLNIDAIGTAIHVEQATLPSVYASTVNGTTVFNAGMVANEGFSDSATQLAGQAHQYTFTFASGVAVNDFSLHMLDFGDFSPTGSESHLARMTAYGANDVVVSSQELSYTTVGNISSVYGDLAISGDAIAATPGQPGNWIWNVSGAGIVRIVLEFGAGYDPNIGFDLLTFSIGCP